MKDPLKLAIKRISIYDSALPLLDFDSKDLRNRNLLVTFDQEEAVDLNGVKREFIALITQMLFNPHYGIFRLRSKKTNRVTMNENVHIIHSPTEIRLSARIVALSIIYKCNISIRLCPIFVKALFKYKITLEDVIQDVIF